MTALQRSPEWFQSRCGSLGASSVYEVVAKTKSGWSSSRANCEARLIIERITRVPQDGYVNAAMQHGIDTEEQARAFYSFITDNEVEEVGLIKHPNIAWTHASPDGLIGDDGIVELKCPQPAAHLALLTGEPIPSKYLTQVGWQMACTGRQWADFVSYSPAFPENMRMFSKRIERDDKAIGELERLVEDFLAEVDAKIEALTARFGMREAA